MEGLLWVFAAIGFGTLIFAFAHFRRTQQASTPPFDILSRLVLQESALLETFKARFTLAKAGLIERYELEFYIAAKAIFGSKMAENIANDKVNSIQILVKFVAALPDDVLEAQWVKARQGSSRFRNASDPEAVCWNLAWLVLGGEILLRLSREPEHRERAIKIISTATTVMIPGALNEDYMHS